MLNYSANAITFLWNDVGSSTNQATVVCSQTSYVNYHVVHVGINFMGEILMTNYVQSYIIF